MKKVKGLQFTAEDKEEETNETVEPEDLGRKMVLDIGAIKEIPKDDNKTTLTLEEKENDEIYETDEEIIVDDDYIEDGSETTRKEDNLDTYKDTAAEIKNISEDKESIDDIKSAVHISETKEIPMNEPNELVEKSQNVTPNQIPEDKAPKFDTIGSELEDMKAKYNSLMKLHAVNTEAPSPPNPWGFGSPHYYPGQPNTYPGHGGYPGAYTGPYPEAFPGQLGAYPGQGYQGQPATYPAFPSYPGYPPYLPHTQDPSSLFHPSQQSAPSDPATNNFSEPVLPGTGKADLEHSEKVGLEGIEEEERALEHQNKTEDDSLERNVKVSYPPRDENVPTILAKYENLIDDVKAEYELEVEVDDTLEDDEESRRKKLTPAEQKLEDLAQEDRKLLEDQKRAKHEAELIKEELALEEQQLQEDQFRANKESQNLKIRHAELARLRAEVKKQEIKLQLAKEAEERRLAKLR